MLCLSSPNVVAMSSHAPSLASPSLPQVPLNGQHLSCCTVVRGMQRNIFVVPRMEVGGDEIAELETQAATDPEAKKKLIPLLHVSDMAAYSIWNGFDAAA